MSLILITSIVHIGSQRSMLVEKEMITTDSIITLRNDASSKQVDAVVKLPKSMKQPKLCTTHYVKKECNIKPYDSPKFQPNSHGHKTSEGAATMSDIFNLSAVFCSAVILPTFYILFFSILH